MNSSRSSREMDKERIDRYLAQISEEEDRGK